MALCTCPAFARRLWDRVRAARYSGGMLTRALVLTAISAGFTACAVPKPEHSFEALSAGGLDEFYLAQEVALPRAPILDAGR
jgi:hypothetical protein